MNAMGISVNVKNYATCPDCGKMLTYHTKTTDDKYVKFLCRKCKLWIEVKRL